MQRNQARVLHSNYWHGLMIISVKTSIMISNKLSVSAYMSCGIMSFTVSKYADIKLWNSESYTTGDVKMEVARERALASSNMSVFQTTNTSKKLKVPCYNRDNDRSVALSCHSEPGTCMQRIINGPMASKFDCFIACVLVRCDQNSREKY